MLKLIRLSAALSAAAVLVSLPQIVLSRPSSEASSYPTVRHASQGSPFCYMRTQRGTTLNLEKLCRADDGSGTGNRATNAAPNPTTPNPAANTPTANTTPNGRTRTFTFTGSPSRDVTPNRTNTGTNTNANGMNTGTNTNASGTNTGTNANTNGR